MMSFRILGVFISDVVDDCSRMEKVFHIGSPIEITFAPIIQSARYTRIFVKALGTRIDSTKSTSTRDVVHATRCHVHLVILATKYH